MFGQRHGRRRPAGMRVAAGGAVVTAAVLGMVGSVWAAGAVTVCVPETEGKPIVTPKAGVCKPKYNLAELPEVTYVKEGVDKKPTVQFSGENVQVENGTGQTFGTPNGEGNLVIGYDEDLGRGVEGPYPQTGSHNLVFGNEQEFTGEGAINGGRENKTSGESAVAFGFDNEARNRASVLGGSSNNAFGELSSISGGQNNAAGGEWSSVGGGERNTASGQWSSVSGGGTNEATSARSSVSGGALGKATGPSSAVSGGGENVASGVQTSVTGGLKNEATKNDASVSGGRKNKATGTASAILGEKLVTAAKEYEAKL